MAFDHMFDHFAKNSLISYPGVAQLVGRLIWVQDAGSSNLPTRTKSQNLHCRFWLFSLFIACRILSASSIANASGATQWGTIRSSATVSRIIKKDTAYM